MTRLETIEMDVTATEPMIERAPRVAVVAATANEMPTMIDGGAIVES